MAVTGPRPDQGGSGAVHVDARTDRQSATMAAMAAAPPAECPAIAIRDVSISPAPGQAGCAPVSSSSTKQTSAALPAATSSLLARPRARTGEAGSDPPVGKSRGVTLVRVVNPGHHVAVAGQVLG